MISRTISRRRATGPGRPRERSTHAAGRTRERPPASVDAAPATRSSLRRKASAPGQSHEPGKSDSCRSVSWLTGHRATLAFPDCARRRASPSGCGPSPDPREHRTHRLQLQGQPRNCPPRRAHRVPVTGANKRQLRRPPSFYDDRMDNQLPIPARCRSTQDFCAIAFQCPERANRPIADTEKVTAMTKLLNFGWKRNLDNQMKPIRQTIGSARCANTNSPLSGWQGIAVRKSRKASDAKVASNNKKLRMTERAGTIQRSNMQSV